MGKGFTQMDATHREFVERQRIFFTGSAAAGGRVNVSPKDGASLRVLGPDRVVYLDQTRGRAADADVLRF
jgi:predicted pyridoxine 5'-phosphate oxidase superfamily flavin-nucleotide-binding protein